MNDLEGYEFCRNYMTDGEYILWKGRPEKGNLFTGQEVVMLPFSLLWLAFSVYWEMTAIRSADSWFMVLWGIPFVAIGIYLFVGRFFMTAYLRNRTFYVITNKKIIIRRGSRIQMHDGRNLPSAEIVIHKNGCGTLKFGQMVYTRNGYRNGTAFMIENVADVTQVQNAIDSMDR